MSSGLDKLVSDLPKKAFKYTSEEFTDKKSNVTKSAYPYDYMDCYEKFDQTELPTKEQFYSILNDQHVTMGNTTMQGKFGKPSILRQWVNIMTYTLRVMYFY